MVRPWMGTSTRIRERTRSITDGALAGVPGKVGGAFSFDGIGAFVDYGSDTSLNVGDGADFSIDGWFKTTDAARLPRSCREM